MFGRKTAWGLLIGSTAWLLSVWPVFVLPVTLAMPSVLLVPLSIVLLPISVVVIVLPELVLIAAFTNYLFEQEARYRLQREVWLISAVVHVSWLTGFAAVLRHDQLTFWVLATACWWTVAALSSCVCIVIEPTPSRRRLRHR